MRRDFTRRMLDIQGFDGVGDELLAQTAGWLRLAPALCAAFAAVGTGFGWAWLLWALAVLALFGAVLPFHPFDLLYNAGIRRLTGTPALPSNGGPRRFACALGAVWLVVTGALFAAGADVAGYVLGAAFVAAATLVATTHVCIPSILFRTACGQMPSLQARRA
jgi:hypothetical protein